jgi:hypothetical protein
VLSDPFGEGQLIGAEAKCGTHRRIELAHGPPSDLVDRVVEDAHALHGSVREPLRERAFTRIQTSGGAAQHTVCVGVVLENAQDDFIGGLPRG